MLTGNDIWVDTNADRLGDTPYYSHRITMATASWSSGWNAAIDAFVDESCRAVYEPIGRLDCCSYFGTLLTLRYGGVPFIETETFVRVDLEDGVIDDQWIGPWPTGEQLMVGQAGRYTTKDDFIDLMRQSLEQVFDDTGNNVTAVFGPRCRQHVGLESTGVYTSQTTPDSTNDPALGWVSLGAALSLNDAIWDWYSSAGVLYRTLDTGDVVTDACEPPRYRSGRAVQRRAAVPVLRRLIQRRNCRRRRRSSPWASGLKGQARIIFQWQLSLLNDGCP